MQEHVAVNFDRLDRLDERRLPTTSSERLLSECFIPRSTVQPQMPELGSVRSLTTSIALPQLSFNAEQPSLVNCPALSADTSLRVMPEMFPGMDKAASAESAVPRAAEIVSQTAESHHNTHQNAHHTRMFSHQHRAPSSDGKPASTAHKDDRESGQVWTESQRQARAIARAARADGAATQVKQKETESQVALAHDDDLIHFEMSVNKAAVRKVEKAISDAACVLPNLLISAEKSAVDATVSGTEGLAEELHSFAKGLRSWLENDHHTK